MVDAINGVNNNQTSVVKGTAVAAGIGALAGAGGEIYAQKHVYKIGPDFYTKQIKEIEEFLSLNKPILGLREKPLIKKEKFLKMTKDTILYKRLENLKKCIENPEVKELLKTGKINWKTVTKVAGVAGLVTGGVYLAYRGIKALVHKDK